MSITNFLGSQLLTMIPIILVMMTGLLIVCMKHIIWLVYLNFLLSLLLLGLSNFKLALSVSKKSGYSANGSKNLEQKILQVLKSILYWDI